MSEGAAGRRVAAARVCRHFPEAFALVAGGELHLSALCALAPHVTTESASELFEACLHKTRRQVDELLAARFPKADVREQIRRLPGGELEPLSAGRFGVHFTADGELRGLIERARAISSHALPNGDLASLMKVVFGQFVKREEARRFVVGRKPRTARPPAVKPRAANPHASTLRTAAFAAGKVRREGAAATTPPGGVPRNTPSVTRHIPAAVRREVYARDQGQCSFVAADGRRCEARARLELITSNLGRGVVGRASRIFGCDVGPTPPSGVSKRVNQLHARKCFGALHIAAKIAARRTRVVPGCLPSRDIESRRAEEVRCSN